MPDHPSLLHRLLRRFTGGAESPETTRVLRDLTTAHQRQTAMLDSRLKALAALVTQRASAKDASEVLHAIWALNASIAEESPPGTLGAEQPIDARMLKELDAVAKGGGPILVGPWTGEVGFELLYWAPFVEWFRSRWRIPANRFVIVSRGGVASWYGMPDARYVDIFSLLTPAAFLERAAREKQREVSALDREIADAAGARSGVAPAAHLHPRLMYHALSPFWKDQAGFGLVERFTSHRRLEAIDDPVLSGLPDAYVAVRFYSSNCFPDKEGNRAAVRAAIDALAQRTPVVVLSSGLKVDDHADYGAAGSNRVISIGADASPERNLAVQTAVIARARAFVGTYGGYSYLAVGSPGTELEFAL